MHFQIILYYFNVTYVFRVTSVLMLMLITMFTVSSLDPILSQLYPLHTLRPVFKFNLTIILASMPWSRRLSFPFRYTDYNFVCIFSSPHACCVSRPFHFVLTTLTIFGRTHIVNLFVMNFFFPSACYFLSLGALSSAFRLITLSMCMLMNFWVQ